MDAGILQSETLQTIWTSVIWAGAIAATPIALMAAIVCCARRVRPATRHAVALAALLSFVTSALVSTVWRPDWLALARQTVPVANPEAIVRAEVTPDEPTLDDAPREFVASVPDADLGSAAHCDDANTALPAALDCKAAAQDDCNASIDTATSAAALDPPRSAAAATSPKQAPPRRSHASAEPIDQPAVLLDRFIALRDAIVAVPPLPLVVWLGGVALLILVAVIRAFAARRTLCAARPAPREIVAEVANASAALGLTTAPMALVTDARVSPLVWCGLTPRLVIPTELWETLDQDSRRAVLVHELAHVRRRDHRWCWLATIIRAAYWWHPLVWWLHHRLRDDAELCCDAWVTVLLPRSRRAYAEALLAATEFLSLQPGTRRPRISPTMSLGVVPSSSRPSKRIAQRLARRITMVMTDRTAPRLSVLGALLAVAALGIGAFVTPGLACPPEQQEARAGKAVPAPRAVIVRPAEAASPGITFHGEAPAIDAMAAPKGAPHGNPVMPAWREARAPFAVTFPSGSGDGEMTRAYYLPAGKLEALVELMSRQDVPIFIEANDDHIVVHGNGPQQEVFEAFVRLIHPEARAAKAGAKAKSKGNADQLKRELKAKQSAMNEAHKYKSVLEQLMRSRSDAERQADEVRHAAEAARERAEQVRTLMGTMRDQVSDTSDQAAATAVHQALQSLANRANVLDREADQKVTSLDSLERRIAQLEAQLEATEAQLERISAILEESNAMSDAEDEDGASGEDQDDAATGTTASSGAFLADLAKLTTISRPVYATPWMTTPAPAAPAAPCPPCPPAPPTPAPSTR